MILIVDGMEREIVSGPLTTLLQVLREELGATGPKAGCQQGGCGACTVLVDGEPRRACLTASGTLDGATITTVEGLGGLDALSEIQKAFYERYAAQCGFCTSGMMLASNALIERKGGDVDRESVIEALAGHYCRCTGYEKIIEAVTAASRGDVGDVPILEPGQGEPEVEVGGHPG